MSSINWLDHCVPCANWCCHDENPYASRAELEVLGVDQIGSKTDGSCMFLEGSGRCGVYQNRPLECRIFPYDIVERDDALVWAVWGSCPVSPLLDHEQRIGALEIECGKRWDIGYIKEYVEFHKVNQPEKYSAVPIQIIRELRWPARKG